MPILWEAPARVVVSPSYLSVSRSSFELSVDMLDYMDDILALQSHGRSAHVAKAQEQGAQARKPQVCSCGAVTRGAFPDEAVLASRSVRLAGHVALQLDDEHGAVPPRATHPLHPGLVSALRLHRQNPLPTSFE